MKVSEYLSELNSHDIYNANGLGTDYREKTGEDPCWPIHTVAETVAEIEARGLGGRVEGPDDERVVFGHEIVEACARKYINFSPFAQGRGTRFRQCLEALKKAGF